MHQLNLLDYMAAACYDSGYLWWKRLTEVELSRNTCYLPDYGYQVKLKYPINIAYGSLHRSLATGTELRLNKVRP